MNGLSLSFHSVVYLLVVIAYVLGSVPFGIIFSRGSGVNLRRTGSGNIGATNVLRSVGKMPAVLTLFFDFLKGALPVLLCAYVVSSTLFNHEPSGNDAYTREFWMAVTGLAVVCGHMFSVFLAFRGGKGVATGFGVLVVYSPMAALVALLVWITVVATTRYVSLGSVIGVGVLPVVFAVRGAPYISIVFAIVLALLVIIKHSSNIRNLLSGRESKLGKKL